MKLRRIRDGGETLVQVAAGEGWVALAHVLAHLPQRPSPEDSALWSRDLIAFLGAPANARAEVERIVAQMRPDTRPDAAVLIPFEPRSYRDFMLYERHAIDAARGFVGRFMPAVAPIVRAYEAVTRTTFPALKPKALWYRQPVYYMGNHLAFVTDGAAIAIPSYTRALDYELELGCVLAHGLLDATPQQAEAAIGGFVVFNDFSARDVQLAEMRSAFGPQKAKHFANAISSVVVTADEILPHWRALKGSVRINGTLISEPASAEPRWSLGEAIAHASRSEQLYPGEFFGSGTLPGGSGIETGRLLAAGDAIEIAIDRIGTLTNPIAASEDAP